MNKALRGKIGTYIGVVLIIVWGLAPCLLDDRDGVARPRGHVLDVAVAHQSHAVQLHRGARSRREGELHSCTDEQPHHRGARPR